MALRPIRTSRRWDRYHSLAQLTLLLALGSVGEAGDLVFQRHVVSAESEYSAVAVLDVNHDGRQDILCGGFWYEAPTWRRHFVRDVEHIGGRFDGYSHLPMDVNGDGWTDIITVNFRSRSIKWIEHPGESLGAWSAHTVNEPGSMETGRLFDVDGDGRVDVLPNGQRFAAWWEVKTGSTPEWIRHELPVEVAGHGVGFGDIDGDGRGDVVGPLGWAAAPHNPRSDRWIWHPEFNLGRASIPVLVVDVDEDGDNDLVWTRAHGFGVYWMEQTETDGTRRWTHHTIDTSWSQCHSPLWADMDGDGKKELVAGKRYMAHEGRDPGAYDPLVSYRYEFSSSARTWLRWPISEGEHVGFGLDPKVVDLDHDGDLDLVVCGRSGLYWMENQRSASSGRQAAEVPQYDDLDWTVVKDAAGTSKPLETPFDWGLRRSHFLDFAQQVLGAVPNPSVRVPLEVQVLKRRRVGEAVVTTVSFQTTSRRRVKAEIWLREHETSLPGLILLNPRASVVSGSDPSRSPAGENVPLVSPETIGALVQRGYACIVPELTSARLPRAHDQGLRVIDPIWDCMRAADVLETLPQVNSDRLGILGEGKGAEIALLTAAFDQRMVATLCRGEFAIERDPELDLAAWIASIAPRSLSFHTGSRNDPMTELLRQAVRKSARINGLFGTNRPPKIVESRLTSDSEEVHQNVYDWLEDRLKNGSRPSQRSQSTRSHVDDPVEAAGAKLKRLKGESAFTEGPAVDDMATEDRQARDRNRRRNDISEMLSKGMASLGDTNEDKRLTKDEFLGLAAGWFNRLDTSKANRLSQQQFLKIEDLLPRQRVRRPGTPSRYLGLFVALDTDQNGSIDRNELHQKFDQWFDAWDTDARGYLDIAMIVAGLRSSLPRTNMGTGLPRESQARLPGLPQPPPSPVLSPADAIKTIQLVDGFHVELAAAEPMIEDPVALSFDEDGRLYVLQMRSFMLDIDRTGEREPIGRISLLVDENQDGRFDRSTIFADGLILPRAVSAVSGGVLYVSDYKLYFARDIDADGKADKTQLLDPDYGDGNVEHAPNGLLTAMDNWIYNARSQYRYRWFGNVLIKQATEHRGQWGMTQDNYGRLFFNVNNSQLLGDYTPPNYMGRNAHHPTSAGLNLFVATDQRVFTRRMNTAVNRGYLPEVLDESGRLYVFASSCGPVIYRGDNYPPEFVGNAFVCDSAANLIKRNLVFDANLTLSSRFAYEDREFLASTDERFRPVNLFNGPDGTLWAVDMYRGINQYGIFMTEYLRRETLERGLDQGIHLGRIYRIVSDQKAPAKPPRLSQLSSAELVTQLSHANGWIRDTAQRLLRQRADQEVVPRLLQVISQGSNPLGRIHALWTLEGLLVELPESLRPAEGSGAPKEAVAGNIVDDAVRLIEVAPHLEFAAPSLTPEALDACVQAMSDEHPQVQVAAIRVLESLIRRSPDGQVGFRQALTRRIEDAPLEVVFQIALTAGNLLKPDAIPLLVEIAGRHPDQPLIREAIVSGLHRWELPFLKALLADPRWSDEKPGQSALLQALASAILRERHPVNVDELLRLAAEQSDDASAWRRRGLLAGTSSSTATRSSKPIRLRSQPTALADLLATDDPTTRKLAIKTKASLAWPGHQFDLMRDRPPGRRLTIAEQRSVAEGKIVFKQVCAGCHGLSGEGIRPLAAPLADSDWVLGSEDRLVRVLLHGLTGAVTVDGITYEPPIVLPAMPAVGILEDAKIAAVLSYIRRAWGHEAEPVSKDRVAEIRRATAGRVLPWTETELSELSSPQD